jgi:hypothetical protein
MRNVRAKAAKAILDCVGQDMTPILEILWELQDGTGQTRKSGHFLDDGNGSSSKTPLEWAVETVRSAGFTGNDITLLDGCDCSKLLPNEVMLVLEQDPKNDKYERVKYVNRLGGGMLEAKNSPKGQELAELKMRFKAAVAATATASTKEPEPDPFDDDEFANM